MGFKLFQEKAFEKDGKPVVEFIMKPTSIIIAAIVDPIHFIFSKENRDIVEIDGRTLPKKEVDGKLKDSDPEIVYHRLLSKVP